MSKLVLANLKMYQCTKEEVNDYINKLKEVKNKFIVFPSVIYLEKFIQNNFICGVQNASAHNPGPYTSEVSIHALKNIGVKYVLLGHSEVRQNMAEDDELINLKIKQALDNNLKVVLCVGENLEAYNQSQTKDILKNQINNALKNINEEVIISYEPVWAIGSGKTPTNSEIEDIVSYIKSLFNYNIKVLYGGSVSDNNIETLNEIPNVDGFLIGKAATKPSSLIKIIEVAEK